MTTLRQFKVLFLIVFSCWSKGCASGIENDVSKGYVLPVATGTFWQIGAQRLDTWTDKQLADEVLFVKNMGMNLILIHYSAYWDPRNTAYYTFIPDMEFKPYVNLKDRNPLDVIFKAAEALDVQIIIGDFLVPPNIRYERPEEAFRHWLSEDAMDFRRTLIERYNDSPSLYGYYIANEPNPNNITSSELEELWRHSTVEVAGFVKSIKQDLKVIHSIGLYPEWFNDKPSAPSSFFLDRFWRPWVSQISEVDIWMIIDGIGTSLSTHAHTAKAQKWCKDLVSEYSKEFWIDVENAKMTSEFVPFHISQLKKSLEIAAETADRIVVFEHLSYMSPNNEKDLAEQLYLDYLTYRWDFIGK